MEVDVVIIGAGSAGLVARRAAKGIGASVVLCDGGTLGTTCARVGCMPSKLLIAAATSARAVRRAPQFGVLAEAPVIDGPAVMKRVQDERDRFTGFVLRGIEEIPEGEFLAQNVYFEAPGLMRAEDGTEIRYKSAVIATGTKPFVPPPYTNLKDTLYTSDTIFDLETVPKRLAVIGAGVIGLEIGQAFAALNSQVTVLSIDDSLSILSDPDVYESYKAPLSKEVDLYLSSKTTGAEEKNGEAVLTWTTSSGEEKRGTFDVVLVAAGRQAGLKSLGLDKLGIDFDHPRDLNISKDRLQIPDHPIFAAGDVNGLRPLLHEATDEGRIAGENAARIALEGRKLGGCFERRASVAIAFTEPQTASAGLSFRDLEEGSYEVGEATFTNQGRSRVDLVNEGMIHVYGHKTDGRLLGFEMCGPSAEHVAHLLSWAIQQKLTVFDVLDMPFYHPVIEEGVRTSLQRLAKNLALGTNSRLRAKECAPTAVTD